MFCYVEMDRYLADAVGWAGYGVAKHGTQHANHPAFLQADRVFTPVATVFFIDRNGHRIIRLLASQVQ